MRHCCKLFTQRCPRRLLITNKNVKHVIDDVAMIITRHTTLDKGTPVSEGTPGTTRLHLGTTASVLKVAQQFSATEAFGTNSEESVIMICSWQ